MITSLKERFGKKYETINRWRYLAQKRTDVAWFDTRAAWLSYFRLRWPSWKIGWRWIHTQGPLGILKPSKHRVVNVINGVRKENYVWFLSAILENGGWQLIQILLILRSLTHAKNSVSDVDYAPRELLQVHICHAYDGFVLVGLRASENRWEVISITIDCIISLSWCNRNVNHSRSEIPIFPLSWPNLQSLITS